MGRVDIHSCFPHHSAFLMEGAPGERLKREFDLMPDEDIAWAALVRGERGREALKTLWGEYIATARRHNLPFLATTPTRRANIERVLRSHYDESIIAQNVEFLRAIQESSGIEMAIGGLMGCKGDAYRATDVLPVDEAEAFHGWQAGLFAEAGVDFLFAGILPALPEAIGMARAMESTGFAYIISFMIRENGRLIDGTAIHDAIAAIDAETVRQPLCYMTNCVHPLVLLRALQADFNRTELVGARFCGIQANTSPLPPEALDGLADLKASGGAELAEGISKLKEYMTLKIVGGCCGTDNTHMEEIASVISFSK